MKFNNKILKLIKAGFELETITKLSESEIEFIANKIIKEQQSPARSGTISVKKNEQDLAKNLAKSGFNVKMETDEAKTEENNPWSICTAQLKKEFGTSKRSSWNSKQKAKYERCVTDVKKGLKEGKTFKDTINNQLESRIKKNELLEYLSKMSLK